MNNLRKVLFTEPCPSETCGVLIQKNGGCAHMKCARCNYEFCWRCKGSFFQYQHLDKEACAGITFAKNGTIFMLFFMLICSIIYKADLNPQRMLLNLLYNSFIFGIAVFQTIAFYNFKHAAQKILFFMFLALLSLSWSVLDDAFQIYLFFASFWLFRLTYVVIKRRNKYNALY